MEGYCCVLESDDRDKKHRTKEEKGTEDRPCVIPLQLYLANVVFGVRKVEAAKKKTLPCRRRRHSLQAPQNCPLQLWRFEPEIPVYGNPPYLSVFPFPFEALKVSRKAIISSSSMRALHLSSHPCAAKTKTGVQNRDLKMS